MKKFITAVAFAVASLVGISAAPLMPADSKVTVNYVDKPAEQVLKEVSRQSGLNIVYRSDKARKWPKITVKATGRRADEVIAEIAGKVDCPYSIKDNIVTFGKEASPSKGYSVSGYVYDENDEPLTGASVYIEGSNFGTVSDINGYFKLNVTGADPVMKVSYIGMNPYSQKLTPLSADKEMKIKLEPNSVVIDEVLVTGYQTISKERSTGAFSKIDTKNLETQRISGIDNILEGHVAGYSDGLLRGVTTMNAVTTPLYVIDGFPVEKTQNDGWGHWEESVPDINVEDIESITVLKDAAATSIYGARAANGVIVINTKKADRGKVDVSFSANLTFHPYRTYTGHLLGSEDYVAMEREYVSLIPGLKGEGAADYAKGYLNDREYTSPGVVALLKGIAGQMSSGEVEETLRRYASAGNRYYKDVDRYGKRNPFYQQYNLRVASGSDKNRFNVSFSYRHNQQADKYTHDQSFGISLQDQLNLTKWLRLDVGSYINYADGKTQTYTLDQASYGDATGNFTIAPYFSLGTPENPTVISDEERYEQYYLDLLSGSFGGKRMDLTPMEEMGMGIKKRKDLSTRTYARLNISFTDWLKLTTQFQYEAAEYKTRTFNEKERFETRNLVLGYANPNSDGSVKYNIPEGNIFKLADNSTRAYNFRSQLDFNKTFAGVHDLTAIAGFEIRENKLNYSDQTLYNYDPELLTYTMVDAASMKNAGGWWPKSSTWSSTDMVSIRELTNRFVSMYMNAAYTYDDRYMLTGSVRWDRTNLFGTSSKYQNKPIWSAGAGWRVDKENFMRGISWINMLKLRASYGIGGNIAKNAAPYLTVKYQANNNVGGIQGSIQSRPNPKLRWEKTTTTNVGLDFALLRNRLNGSVEYYYKKGTDLLCQIDGVAWEGFGLGIPPCVINNAAMDNRGVELTLNGIVFADRDWSVTLNGIFGYNHNEVKSVGITAPNLTYLLMNPAAYPQVGNPYTAIYAYRWAGLDANGVPQIYNSEGEVISREALTSIDDVECLGSTVPKWNGSFGANVRYRDFELSALFLYSGGHRLRNTNAAYMSGGIYMGPAAMTDRWQKPGDELSTDIPRWLPWEHPDYNEMDGNYFTNSSYNVLRADNLRLRNLSLSYSIPKSITRKAYVSSARLMVGVENVFTVCRNKDVKYLLGGYDRPNYTFGININF